MKELPYSIDGKKRVEFIDAMRGFAMFLIVFNHIWIRCLKTNLAITDFHSLSCPLELPVLFLISGFVVYKKETVWTLEFILHFLRKKISVLLLSPLLFFIVYIHVMGLGFVDAFFIEPKCGYWFTFILFFFYGMFYKLTC